MKPPRVEELGAVKSIVKDGFPEERKLFRYALDAFSANGRWRWRGLRPEGGLRLRWLSLRR